jgi:hypothetical protein
VNKGPQEKDKVFGGKETDPREWINEWEEAKILAREAAEKMEKARKKAVQRETMEDPFEVGTPRTISPAKSPCLCVQKHVPAIRMVHIHHVIPKSWGGTDETKNLVSVCPSGHDIIHGMLRSWEKSGGVKIGNNNPFLYSIALRGWEQKPN